MEGTVIAVVILGIATVNPCRPATSNVAAAHRSINNRPAIAFALQTSPLDRSTTHSQARRSTSTKWKPTSVKIITRVAGSCDHCQHVNETITRVAGSCDHCQHENGTITRVAGSCDHCQHVNGTITRVAGSCDHCQHVNERLSYNQ